MQVVRVVLAPRLLSVCVSRARDSVRARARDSRECVRVCVCAARVFPRIQWFWTSPPRTREPKILLSRSPPEIRPVRSRYVFSPRSLSRGGSFSFLYGPRPKCRRRRRRSDALRGTAGLKITNNKRTRLDTHPLPPPRDPPDIARHFPNLPELLIIVRTRDERLMTVFVFLLLCLQTDNLII